MNVHGTNEDDDALALLKAVGYPNLALSLWLCNAHAMPRIFLYNGAPLGSAAISPSF